MTACRSCGAGRDDSLLLRITCRIHEAGNRDCLCPFSVCRPSVPGQRPDCLRRSAVGADIHAIEVGE